MSKCLKDFPELSDEADASRKKKRASEYVIPTLDLLDAIMTYAPERFLELSVEADAKHGKSPDTVLVEDFLRALCNGTYAIPKTVLWCALNNEKVEPTPPSIPPDLVGEVLWAIAAGDYKRIRNFAGIVKNVYERRNTIDGKLTFSPVKPAKLATLENAKKSGTVKLSGKDIAAPGISERSGQRFARIVGAKPAKPGRKKKLKFDMAAPKEKPVTAAALQRDVAAGVKAFWENRKRK